MNTKSMIYKTPTTTEEYIQNNNNNKIIAGRAA